MAKSEKNDNWIEDFLEKMTPRQEVDTAPPHVSTRKNDYSEGVEEEKNDTQKEEKNVKKEVVNLVEEDEESGAMFLRQQEYEDGLEEYAPDHPKRMFPHNFLRDRYLPVVTVGAKETLESDPEAVAEELKKEAYYEGKGGVLKLDQRKFCMVWKKRFNYAYAGAILTPHGEISVPQFKDEIVKMLFIMGTEKVNIDATAAHIYSTYISAYSTDEYSDSRKIPFRNGDLVLNKDNKSFTFYDGCLSPVPYRFDYDFVNIPNCLEPEFPNFRSWLDGLFDEEDQYSVKQMLGYLLIPSNRAQEAFFIIGKGGSGKSILTDCIIPKMLGKAMFPISIGTFFKNQFQVGTSAGKLCMVDDDIGGTVLTKDDSARFKSFVTARTIQVERKYCDPIMTDNVARIVCSGNHMINSDDKTDGFTRRLHPIYAKPRTIEKVDRNFPSKIESEIEMIVLWALEGLIEMLGNDGAPYRSRKTGEHFETYAESQKWEEQFINDCFEFKEDTVTYSQDIKATLDEWAKDNVEMCGDAPLSLRFKMVSAWLRDEGADKLGFIYKRGIRRGDKYNARGYLNMSRREDTAKPSMFLDERGRTMIRLNKKKS